MIRVLHVLGSAQREGTSIARIVRTLARDTSGRACFLGNHGPLVDELRDAGIPAEAVNWMAGARDPLGALRFASVLRASGADIVHQHQGSRSVRWVVRRVSRARVLVHLHGAARDVERAIGVADGVVAVSNFAARGVPECSIVYPGIELKSDAGCSKVRPVVGMATRLVAGKGVADLLAAMENVPGEIEIAGEGPLRGEAGGRATLLGWRTDVAELMTTWSVLALPSADEGFGMSALEAMAAGVPVVGYRSGALPEVVNDSVTGFLVEPGDIAGLAERLRLLLSDPELRAQMGRAARERVRRDFGALRMKRETQAIYEALMERGGAPSRHT